MKTIGMIGGMSWESSLEYYRIVNEGIKTRLGGLHSAKCLMYSVDFAEVEALQHTGQWDAAGRMLVEAAEALQKGGADFIVICTNTMHISADMVQAAVPLPLLHIADATAERVQASGIRRIGLLGTRFTMEKDFYKGRLTDKFGLEVSIPDAPQREIIHRIIYEELVLGIIRPESRQQYLEIMADMVAKGAEGIILGCTEIGLLVSQAESAVPLFDTTRIHSEAAVEWAIR